MESGQILVTYYDAVAYYDAFAVTFFHWAVTDDDAFEPSEEVTNDDAISV